MRLEVLALEDLADALEPDERGALRSVCRHEIPDQPSGDFLPARVGAARGAVHARPRANAVPTHEARQSAVRSGGFPGRGGPAASVRGTRNLIVGTPGGASPPR